mgnify:CR=1 FL=1
MPHHEKADKLVDQLHVLEERRQHLVNFRLLSLLVIFILIGYIAYSIDSQWEKFDKEDFGKALVKRTQEELKPDVDVVIIRAKKELYPALQVEFKKQLAERLPKMKKDLLQIGSMNKDKLSQHLSAVTADMLNESTAELQKEFPDEDIEEILKNLHLTKEKLATHLANKLSVVQEGFNSESKQIFEVIAKLESSPESSKLSVPEAEKQLMAAVLDLIKYEMIPEEGERVMAQQGGE